MAKGRNRELLASKGHVNDADQLVGELSTHWFPLHHLPFTIHFAFVPLPEIKFANSRYAPGTPAGNCRKKLMPV